jgi:hypothetical protein
MVVSAVCLVAVAGCLTSIDPATGQRTYALDPNSPAVAIGEMVGTGAGAIAPFLGGTWGLVVGAIAGLAAAWAKIKPSLTQARTKADHYYAATASVVTAIEEFKKSSPDAWLKLETAINEQLTKQGVDPKTIENVIRAIRGLPAKA